MGELIAFIAQSYFFPTHVNVKVSLVQRCFLCSHCLVDYWFIGLIIYPDFEIISCCKFSNYFRGGITGGIVVPSGGFGSGEPGQRREIDNGSHCAIEVVSYRVVFHVGCRARFVA